MTRRELIEWRGEYGLSQKSAADFFAVSPETVAAWERGLSDVSRDLMATCCQAFTNERPEIHGDAYLRACMLIEADGAIAILRWAGISLAAIIIALLIYCFG
jgi:DNA-binding XRE family transcriptional regulator